MAINCEQAYEKYKEKKMPDVYQRLATHLDNLPASFAKFFFGLSPEPLRLLPNDIHRKLLLMHQKFLVKIRIPYIVLILG